jgi:hypothetical protein
MYLIFFFKETPKTKKILLDIFQGLKTFFIF